MSRFARRLTHRVALVMTVLSGFPFLALADIFTEEIKITDRSTNPPTVSLFQIPELAAGVNEQPFSYTTTSSMVFLVNIMPKSVYLLEPATPGGCPEPQLEACTVVSDAIQLTKTFDTNSIAAFFYTVTVYSDPNPSIGSPLPFDATFVENGDFIDITRALFPETGAGVEPLQVSIKSCSCDVPEPDDGFLSALGGACVAGCIARRPRRAIKGEAVRKIRLVEATLVA